MSAADQAVQTIAVVGGGAMGRGIAYCAMAAGYGVRVTDANIKSAEAARDWAIKRAAQDSIKSADIVVADSIEKASTGADLVIEAVVENLAVKIAVMRAAAGAAGSKTILATNTSGMSVTDIGTGAGVPERVVGMHFFNPVHRMKLCEIIVGKETGEQAIAIATAVASRMGKTPVRANDTAGFLASRLNCALGNEALKMLEQEVGSAEAIDTAAKLGLNHPMGPLELLDLVGLDVRLAALNTLSNAYGERFAPTKIHRHLVDEGRLGVKSGRGVYRYGPDGKKIAE